MSRPYVPADVRRRVADQAKHRCGYCQTQEDVIGEVMEVEHIRPVAADGPTVEDNLWLACSPCNKRKTPRTVAVERGTGDAIPLFDPRHQEWHDHFAWSDDGTMVVGMTPVGRVTVDAQALNRLTLVRARQRCVAVGWHPPKD